MNKKVINWFYGLGTAFIGGGASAVTATITASMIAPDKFNLQGQIHDFFKLAATTFLVSGFMMVMAYLKQSPLPPESTGNTEQITKPPTQ